MLQFDGHDPINHRLINKSDLFALIPLPVNVPHLVADGVLLITGEQARDFARVQQTANAL